jgi:hypothetical protein
MQTRGDSDVVTVRMHLNGGFTKVVAVATVGLGLADGAAEWDIPTLIIPVELRTIGSRFVLVEDPLYEQPEDVPETYRHLRVEREF